MDRTIARSIIVAAGVLLAALSTARAAENPRKREATSWDASLSRPGEPGEPFEMSGIVRSEKGDSLPNTKVFFYHADSKGRYSISSDEPLHLAAVLRTDWKGRYRIRSVFPGTYGYPAHVHFEILDKPYGVGFVNVRQVGHDAPGAQWSVPVKQASDSVWRLRWDLRAGAAGATGGVPAPRVPELRYPPKAASDSAR